MVPVDGDEHDQEALAKKTREDYDAVYGFRRFRRGWWVYQWEKLTWRYYGLRWALHDRLRASVTVETVLLARAVETLAKCAELRATEEELGAAHVKRVADELNAYLPAKVRIDLSRNGGGPGSG